MVYLSQAIKSSQLRMSDFVVMNEKRKRETREISETREFFEFFRVFRALF
jgi:hypothetical protein